MTNKIYDKVIDDGKSVYHSDGSTSKVYDNVLDDGKTVYHSDGSTSKVYDNVLDDGKTVYRSNGNTSKVYDNVLYGGKTVYHSDGSTSKVYDNVLDDGKTVYHYGGNTNNVYGTSNSPGDVFGGAIGIGIIAICIVLTFTAGGLKGIIPSILFILPLVACIVRKLPIKEELLCFAPPISILGWRLLGNAIWAAGGEAGLFALLGLCCSGLLVALGFAKFYSQKWAGLYIVAAILTVILAAYGAAVPYIFIGILFAIVAARFAFSVWKSKG